MKNRSKLRKMSALQLKGLMIAKMKRAHEYLKETRQTEITKEIYDEYARILRNLKKIDRLLKKKDPTNQQANSFTSLVTNLQKRMEKAPDEVKPTAEENARAVSDALAQPMTSSNEVELERDLQDLTQEQEEKKTNDPEDDDLALLELELELEELDKPVTKTGGMSALFNKDKKTTDSQPAVTEPSKIVLAHNAIKTLNDYAKLVKPDLENEVLQQLFRTLEVKRAEAIQLLHEINENTSIDQKIKDDLRAEYQALMEIYPPDPNKIAAEAPPKAESSDAAATDELQFTSEQLADALTNLNLQNADEPSAPSSTTSTIDESTRDGLLSELEALEVGGGLDLEAKNKPLYDYLKDERALPKSTAQINAILEITDKNQLQAALKEYMGLEGNEELEIDDNQLQSIITANQEYIRIAQQQQAEVLGPVAGTKPEEVEEEWDLADIMNREEVDAPAPQQPTEEESSVDELDELLRSQANGSSDDASFDDLIAELRKDQPPSKLDDIYNEITKPQDGNSQDGNNHQKLFNSWQTLLSYMNAETARKKSELNDPTLNAQQASEIHELLKKSDAIVARFLSDKIAPIQANISNQERAMYESLRLQTQRLMTDQGDAIRLAESKIDNFRNAPQPGTNNINQQLGVVAQQLLNAVDAYVNLTTDYMNNLLNFSQDEIQNRLGQIAAAKVAAEQAYTTGADTYNSIFPTPADKQTPKAIAFAQYLRSQSTALGEAIHNFDPRPAPPPPAPVVAPVVSAPIVDNSEDKYFFFAKNAAEYEARKQQVIHVNANFSQFKNKSDRAALAAEGLAKTATTPETRQRILVNIETQLEELKLYKGLLHDNIRRKTNPADPNPKNPAETRVAGFDGTLIKTSVNALQQRIAATEQLIDKLTEAKNNIQTLTVKPSRLSLYKQDIHAQSLQNNTTSIDFSKPQSVTTRDAAMEVAQQFFEIYGRRAPDSNMSGGFGSPDPSQPVENNNFVFYATEAITKKGSIPIGVLQETTPDQTHSKQEVMISPNELKSLNDLPLGSKAKAEKIKEQLIFVSNMIETGLAAVKTNGPITLDYWPPNLQKVAAAYCKEMGYDLRPKSLIDNMKPKEMEALRTTVRELAKDNLKFGALIHDAEKRKDLKESELPHTSPKPR